MWCLGLLSRWDLRVAGCLSKKRLMALFFGGLLTKIDILSILSALRTRSATHFFPSGKKMVRVTGIEPVTPPV